MSRVMGKYMRIGYGDGEGKTCPHSAPLSCLGLTEKKASIIWSSTEK